MKHRGIKQIIPFLGAVALGLAAGAGVLFLTHPEAGAAGLQRLFTGWGSGQIGHALRSMASLTLLCLSAYMARTAGVLPLGLPGQWMAGAAAAAFAAVRLGFGWISCLLFGAAAGAVWGFLPALLRAPGRARLSLLMDGIALYLGERILTGLWEARENGISAVNAGAIPPEMGGVSAAVPLALLLALTLWFVMGKTTLGYEIRACGLDRKASRHAGIRTEKRIRLALTVSGALVGMAGALHILLDAASLSLIGELPGYAFYGVPAAMLGAAHPALGGLSAALAGWLRAGNGALAATVGTLDAELSAGTVLFGGAALWLLWQAIQSGKAENDEDGR